jgi:putative membrane protein
MKLSKLSIPYRAATKLGTIAVVMLFSSSFALSELTLVRLGILLGAAGLVAGLLLLYEYLYWRNYEVTIGDDSIEIAHGVVSRNTRDIPLRRVQNIDIERKLIPRLLGIAEVRVETAGGNQVEAAVKYLDREDADSFQSRVKQLKNRHSLEDAEEVTETDTPDFELGLRNLSILSATSINAKSIGVFFLLLSIGGGTVGTALESIGLSLSLALIVLAVGSIVVIQAGNFVGNFMKFFDFKLWKTRNSLDYERGMLNRASGSIPREKIQSLIIEENFLKRWLGYATLKVETAGYSADQDGFEQSETVIPLAYREDVTDFGESLENYVTPELRSITGTAKTRYFRRYLLIGGILLALTFGVNNFVTLPLLYLVPAAVLLGSKKAAELKWKNIGYALEENHLIVQTGFWIRKTYVVPYFRVQNLIRSQTVFQRRWHMSSIVVDTAGSVITNPVVPDMESSIASELKEELFKRFRQSLR